jgi:hypothetical protein
VTMVALAAAAGGSVIDALAKRWRRAAPTVAVAWPPVRQDRLALEREEASPSVSRSW